MTITLEDFMDWYPDGYDRFELRDGVAVQMQPTGTHERVAGEVAAVATIEIQRLQRPSFN
ncbi:MULTISPECIES: hypothetical protein [unclassified Microcoleus]|uniref:hypothetical protein n=1 Tax=unclassified Microcoleus TaxID=2642155 RepID=UPI002FCEF4D1